MLSERNEHVEPEGFNDDAGAFGIRFVLVFVTCWFVEYVQLKIHDAFLVFVTFWIECLQLERQLKS